MKKLQLFMSVTLLANFSYMSASSEEIQTEPLAEIAQPLTKKECKEEWNKLNDLLNSGVLTEATTKLLRTFYDQCQNHIPDGQSKFDQFNNKYAEYSKESSTISLQYRQELQGKSADEEKDFSELFSTLAQAQYRLHLQAVQDLKPSDDRNEEDELLRNREQQTLDKLPTNDANLSNNSDNN